MYRGEGHSNNFRWVDFWSCRPATNVGARSVLEARGLLKKMALETLGIAAVRANARCKLDRAATALGGDEGSEARRRTDRYNYEEQQRFRRNLEGHRRNQRFNGWRANRWGG